ncbi:serine--tRNA ligase [bacterium]|nr:serine--tRNA ligase [bacterium]MBR6245336.1 serine--tRNA ligase [bacterium]
MFDVKLILSNPDKVKFNMKNRNYTDFSPVDEILSLSERRKALITESEQTRARQMSRSKEMPLVMKNGTPEEKNAIKEELKELSEKVKSYGPLVKDIEDKIDKIVMSLPNMFADSTPLGKDENSNVVVKTYGEKPVFDFQPKEHFDIATTTIDFERGVKLSGSRFIIYKSDMAKLERAVMCFMLDNAAKNGYTEIVPPVMVSRETMTGSGQLPKFEDDAYKTTDDMFMIPTAEVSLVNMHRGEILDNSVLPIKYAAYTPCFRREAGSYGKDMKGIIRLHQFNKVELVKFCRPEESMAELDSLLANAEEILQLLGIHYRVVNLCSGDLGFNAVKTFDIEVWLPGQQTYREISSCSSTGDFQARRANIRFRRDANQKPELVHLLNGSGLAIDRTLVAIIENYQQSDGSVKVPEVLKKYLGGADRLFL